MKSVFQKNIKKLTKTDDALKKETIFKKNSKACSQKRGITLTISKENEKTENPKHCVFEVTFEGNKWETSLRIPLRSLKI